MFDQLAKAWHNSDTSEKIEACAVGTALLAAAAAGEYFGRGAIGEIAPELLGKVGGVEQPAIGLCEEEGLSVTRISTHVSNPDLLLGIRDTSYNKVLGSPGMCFDWRAKADLKVTKLVDPFKRALPTGIIPRNAELGDIRAVTACAQDPFA
ncbi:MAG TPA: hypothetical protein V6C81_01495 [Planktothrix sp.]|jgi:hypothetical protein